MREKHYYIKNNNFVKSFVAGVVCDLHTTAPDKAIAALRRVKPNIIFAPGDIFESLEFCETPTHAYGVRLLEAAAQIAPTYMSLGNHEIGGVKSWSKKWENLSIEKKIAAVNLEKIKKTGTILLDDEFILKNGVAIGGLTSGLINPGQEPNLGFLDRFEAAHAPKILLCHHPEYINTCLAGRKIDLILAGHAHGGQWQIFGRGVFAPGQGIFPKYTRGVHENRLVISTGLQIGGIPRFFNPTEIGFVHMN